METKPWRDAREATGMSIDDVIVAIRTSSIPKRRWISRSTLSRIENGAEADPFLLVGLAEIYNQRLSDIDPAAAEAFEREREQVISALTCNMTQAA